MKKNKYSLYERCNNLISKNILLGDTMYYLRQPISQWNVFWPEETVSSRNNEVLVCFFRGAKNLPLLKYSTVKSFLKKPKWNIWYGIEIEDLSKQELLTAMKKWMKDLDLKWGKEVTLWDKVVAYWKEW